MNSFRSNTLPTLLLFAVLATPLSITTLCAQTPAPTAYTVVQVNSMFGFPVTETIYRDGSRALIDNNSPARANARATHVRSLYDLKSKTNYSWDLADPNAVCGTGSFNGDWGDPFADAGKVDTGDPANPAKQTGTETLNGIAAKVFEATIKDGKVKVWLDARTGIALREQITPPQGPAQVLVEVKQETLAPPPASVFNLPPVCASAAPPKHVPSDDERIAAETGQSAANFALAYHGPGSKASCTVVVRVMKAGTMQPIAKRFQIAADLSYDVDHPPNYSYGMGVDGTQTFSGGGLRELTSQVRNGVLRLVNPPAYFNLEINLIKPGLGAASALIYRQCFAPQTALLYVVNDPEDQSKGGDWLWDKTGKYSAAP